RLDRQSLYPVNWYGYRPGTDGMASLGSFQWVTREGYTRVVEAARAGVVHAVVVADFSRWGRKGSEWLECADELQRLGVAFISVREGKEQGGLLRFVHGGLSEEYARQLAGRVRPNKEASARNGQHIGPTPYGFTRYYPERTGSTGSRYQAGTLVPDEAAAPTVRALFARYAEGGVSIRDVAHWLNGQGLVSPRGACGPATPCSKCSATRRFAVRFGTTTRPLATTNVPGPGTSSWSKGGMRGW
ncbi:MAG: recombinase, partial [Chloroflexi bacterium]|nr:recombinase [Chloroflexota bacterium]